jgi:hypothetical protein
MKPRESALLRPVAMRLAATEYDRCAEMFRSLSPAQWARTLDAVDFCRAVARCPASITLDELLNTEVPY